VVILLQGDRVERCTADNKNEQVALAYFDSKDQAQQAADALKGWDKANDDIKMGAIAALSKNEKGKIETTKLGPRNTGKGATIGVIAGILTGGLSLVGGAIWGDPRRRAETLSTTIGALSGEAWRATRRSRCCL
jgi:uncharacterized membrane protein